MSEHAAPAVHVETTIADFAAAQRILCRGQYAAWRTWAWLLPSLFLLVAALFVFTAIAQFLGVPEGLDYVVSIPFAFYLYLMSARLIGRFRYKTLLDPRGSFLSPTDLEIAPDGLRWSSHRGEGRTAWHAIFKIVETKTHIYLFIDKAMAHVVPKRSFSSEAAAGEFVTAARSYMDAARPVKT